MGKHHDQCVEKFFDNPFADLSEGYVKLESIRPEVCHRELCSTPVTLNGLYRCG